VDETLGSDYPMSIVDVKISPLKTHILGPTFSNYAYTISRYKWTKKENSKDMTSEVDCTYCRLSRDVGQ